MIEHHIPPVCCCAAVFTMVSFHSCKITTFTLMSRQCVGAEFSACSLKSQPYNETFTVSAPAGSGGTRWAESTVSMSAVEFVNWFDSFTYREKASLQTTWERSARSLVRLTDGEHTTGVVCCVRKQSGFRAGC